MHYRDFMLRELCYDQDLYVIQASLVIPDRDVVMVSILDRFGLLGLFSGAFLHSTYEGSPVVQHGGRRALRLHYDAQRDRQCLRNTTVICDPTRDRPRPCHGTFAPLQTL
jgi:hypothetical protein